jgi:hypothetical protein
VQVRLALQRRATRTLRRHAVRSVWRGAVLVAAVLGAFWVLRGLLRGLRDGTLLGGAVADWVTAVVPVAHLSGWQFGAALFLGLAVTGNYGQGDRRRNPRRLLLGCALATALPLWALARIAARVPVYGPLNCLVPRAVATEVAERLLAARTWTRPEGHAFALAQAARRTGDRERDLDEALRERVAGRLDAEPGGRRLATMVREVTALEASDQARLLDESLPAGLRLREAV